MAWKPEGDRELRRARRDLVLVSNLVPGDRRRLAERQVRGRAIAGALSALGAPSAEAIAEGLLGAVGASMSVPAAVSLSDLGFAGEIALAGRSAFSDESDFGDWEIKTSFTGRDENRALPVFSWPAGHEETAAIRRLADGRLGRPLAFVTAYGAGLRRSGRVLAALDSGGAVQWRRSWRSIEQRLQRKLAATVLLAARVTSAHDGTRPLWIDSARLLWQLDASRLWTLLDTGGAGIGAPSHDRLQLAVRRGQLHRLYRQSLDIRPARHGVREVLAVRAYGHASRPALAELAARRNADAHGRGRHSPAVCASCGTPLAWRASCTSCPPAGFAA